MNLGSLNIQSSLNTYPAVFKYKYVVFKYEYVVFKYISISL